MPWFKIYTTKNQHEFRFHENPDTLLYDYLALGLWQIKITCWNPKPFHYKGLLFFYRELHSALLSGLQLKDAFEHLTRSNTNQNFCDINQAILNELDRGNSLNSILNRLSHKQTQAFCQLINEHGSREDCIASLELSISQLDALLSWSKRLIKALMYPSCIIQIAFLMMMANQLLLSTESPDSNMDLVIILTQYILITSVQVLLFRALITGHACTYVEKYNEHFRLTKLFIIINTLRKSGYAFQQALQQMPNYFVHKGLQAEILKTYYALKLGKSYVESFPKNWFPQQAELALHSAAKDGNIERALTLAASQHEKRWQRNINIFEKTLPVICLLIAGGFVAKTLLVLYSPMFNLSP
ncbi:type II secretion system F family protein [Marinomonas dokdonensis]|uniref:type II secretion system F family protein n=1 Tax=Marinomonas dokdonensis TaxID=328224 RepID=UPI00405578E7